MCLVQQKIFFPTVKYFQVNFFLEKKVVYGCIPENIIENIFSTIFRHFLIFHTHTYTYTHTHTHTCIYIYILRMRILAQNNCNWQLSAAVVSDQRPRTLVGGGGLVANSGGRVEIDV